MSSFFFIQQSIYIMYLCNFLHFGSVRKKREGCYLWIYLLNFSFNICVINLRVNTVQTYEELRSGSTITKRGCHQASNYSFSFMGENLLLQRTAYLSELMFHFHILSYGQFLNSCYLWQCMRQLTCDQCHHFIWGIEQLSGSLDHGWQSSSQWIRTEWVEYN